LDLDRRASLRRIGELAVPSEPAKKRRSPGWAADRLATGVPTSACSSLVLGKVTPSWPYTYWTRPEQSNPEGLVPPHT
jgi:hypothetical protein